MTHEDRRFQELERSQQRQDKRAHLRYLEDEYYDEYDDLDESTGDEADVPSIARLMADVEGPGEPAVIDVPPSGAAVARTPLAEALRVVRAGGPGRAEGEPAE